MFWFFRKKFKIQATGAIPSPFDRRDVFASQIIKLPEKIPEEMPAIQTKVLDQNGYPACVGFSCASLKQEKEYRETNYLDFDGLWIYQRAKEIDGIPDVPGTYLRTGMKVLKDYGAKPLNLNEDPKKYKIGAYIRLDDLSFEGLKKAIFTFGSLLAGFWGDNEGWQTAYIKPPKEPKWGHAVALVGYTKNYLVLKNSWGESWGEGGYGYLPPNYQPFEAWAILTDLPNDWQIEKPKYFFTKDLFSGMKDNDVLMLQKCLKYLGIFPQIIEPTGFFGKITLRAVQTFQATYGIPETGNVGPITRAKLNEIFGS